MNYKLIHGDSLEAMSTMSKNGEKVQGIVCSPPYNSSRTSGELDSNRYGEYNDSKNDKEYREWILEFFQGFDKILEKDGVVVWNQSYGTQSVEMAQNLWLIVAEIIQNTPFCVADQLAWKKHTALPNNISPNKMTRIFENVFVFVRKSEFSTFITNKKVSSIRESGQKMYTPFYNLFEAPNNNQGEHTKVHGATYSTEFVDNIIKMYFPEGKTIFDPFSGTGTTGLSALKNGCNYIGCEMDQEYIDISENRLSKVQEKIDTKLEEW